MFGGAELPAVWAGIFLTAMAESALQFASWAKLEDELETPTRKDIYLQYLEHSRSVASFCVLVRLVLTVLFVALVFLRVRAGAYGPFAAGAVAFAVLGLAELVARTIGRRWSAGVLRPLLPPLYWLSAPLRIGAAGRPNGVQQPDEEPEPEVVEAAKEEIRVALEDGTAEGALEAEEKQMIEGILKFRDVDVAEIMTPRTEIESLHADTNLAEALDVLAGFQHSRIPVHEGTLDSVVGIVYMKDVIGIAGKTDIGRATLRDVMRKPFFIPETKTVGPLLQEFQSQHVQIGVVLDEYGGVSGVVSVEDIMEEIVGEIQDEYDQEDHENRIRRRSAGGIDADARVHIDEVNELFELGIPEDEDYDTIGGFVTAHLARVPEPGEEFHVGPVLVRVLQSDERRVKRVFLKLDEAEEE